MKGEETQSQIYDDVFETFFGEKIAEKVQPCKDKPAEASAENRKTKAENRKMNAEKQEATSRAEIAEEFVYSTMCGTICNALSDSGKAEKVPSDLANKIKKIRSYRFLNKLLRVATSTRNDYATFLATFEEGE